MIANRSLNTRAISVPWNTVCMRVMDKAGNIGFYKGTIALDRVAPTLVSFTTANSSPVALSAASYRAAHMGQSRTARARGQDEFF